MIRVSITNTGTKIDANKRYIYWHDKLICVLNPFMYTWTEEDEENLKIIIDAIEEKKNE